MRYRRSSRRTGRRLGNVVQSFKKVINAAPASVAASTSVNYIASTGTDSVAAGQTSPTDSNVPTGSVIKYIEFQFAIQNLVNVAAFCWLTVQRLETGQTPVNPQVVGGDPLRNQVLHQELFSVGQNQNVNRVVRFKVPPRFQRVKDGSTWRVRLQSDQISTQAMQIIYKFYR